MKVENLHDRIFAEVAIDAAPEVVFAALTEPAQLAAWWGSPETYQSRSWQNDRRPGGKWSSEVIMAKDGSAITVHGVYEVVDPPRALTFTWNPSWTTMPETRVSITLEPTPTGTLLRLVHTGFAGFEPESESHTQGWPQVLGWLAAFCRAESAEAKA
jgi:uncharacterized protein YndB with AHSA1/START domain